MNTSKLPRKLRLAAAKIVSILEKAKVQVPEEPTGIDDGYLYWEMKIGEWTGWITRGTDDLMVVFGHDYSKEPSDLTIEINFSPAENDWKLSSDAFAWRRQPCPKRLEALMREYLPSTPDEPKEEDEEIKHLLIWLHKMVNTVSHKLSEGDALHFFRLFIEGIKRRA